MIYDFRMADNDDFGNIVSIFKRAVERMNSQGIHQWDERYPDTEILQLDVDKQQMYLVTGNGVIVSAAVVNEEQDEAYGSAKWRYKAGKIAALHRLCVDPDFQHRGIGEITIRFIEEMLVKQGIFYLYEKHLEVDLRSGAKIAGGNQ